VDYPTIDTIDLARGRDANAEERLPLSILGGSSGERHDAVEDTCAGDVGSKRDFLLVQDVTGKVGQDRAGPQGFEI
jgi:hypothetical protein